MSPLLAPALVAAAASLAPKPGPVELVRQLGAPDYRDREAAGKALRVFQCAAEPAVRAAALDPNPEVARRAAAVHRLLREDAHWRAVAGTDDRPTPAWVAFRGLVGDTLESRALYLELTAGDRYGRLARAVADPAEAVCQYTAEADRLEAAFETFFPRRGCGGLWLNRRENSLAAAPREDVLLALFLGSLPHPEGAADPKHVRALLDEGFHDLVGGNRKVPARALFDAWLGRRRDPEAQADGLYAALRLGLREAAPAARRVLADPAADPRPVGYALLVLGNHGTPADRPRLAKFRDDARVHHRWSGGGALYTIQLRDVAAVMLLRAAGEDTKGYGFETVRRGPHPDDPDGASYWEGGWFYADAARAAAHARAWAWLDVRPGLKPEKR